MTRSRARGPVRGGNHARRRTGPFFFFTISPVHTDPAAVPSMVTAVQAERYSDAVEEAGRLARSRSLLVSENLPGLSVGVALDGEIVWAEGFG